ncbi:nucleotide-binding oligomerization domain-containing protein 1 isoform X2 [Gouania willdenowi]|uniref:nucleotide-binding oligomerization domain-containing protein 1 isoform X2 n=1 Tax=Gouania willdenowi TaxID=441366 RepID=UPI001055CE2A|nr:nucleotide-binding oligomerization domain-containing protein 1 isoform X2 [Gouania willdenowi]
MEEGRMSCLHLLTFHRELLVSRLRSIQCILDNLLASGYFCEEDIEIVQQANTKADQVRKILDLLRFKGEEACEYFLFVIYKVYDAYIDLQPWLKEINYSPSTEVTRIEVVNTDPISRYSEKMRHEMSRDSNFIMSYGECEETRLEELYIDTQMEMLNERNESLGFLHSLDQLLGDQREAMFNPQGEIIYVMGDAGMGKSILLQKLQNLWSKKELQTDAIFFFNFRCRMFSMLKSSDPISLRELLFRHNCFPDYDPDNEVFEYILRCPEKVIFTFDGFDEIQADVGVMNVLEVASPEHRANPLQLLISLLTGKLLQGSQKVLTARTGIEVQSRVIRKKVVLRGFSPNHLRTYLHLHFKEQEHRELVWNQLEASPHLCGLCSTPLFCWIIFKSFWHLHMFHDSFCLPETLVALTDIFLLLTEVFLSHQALPAPSLLKKSMRCTFETFKAGLKPLRAFARLALLAMEKGSLICDKAEMTACGLNQEDITLGFVRPCYDPSGSSTTFEFLHVTLQSFLAAFALVLDEQSAPSSILKFFTKVNKRRAFCMPLDFCCSNSKKPSDNDRFNAIEHLQFINLFLCGLLSKLHTGLLEQLLPPVMVKKKQALLMSYLSTLVKSHLKGLPGYPSEEGKKVHVMPNFLWILRCVFETRSKDIAQMTAKGISANLIKLGYCNVYSGDCTAINFVLQHRKKLLGLDMDNNKISDYGVKQLRPSFCKMTVVRLCVNQISDNSVEILAEELCKYKVVEVLGLYFNHITDVGAKRVAQIIEECPKLRVLKIGKNQITGIGGRYLANAIQKSSSIFEVGMWGNSIKDEGAEAFAQALRNHPSLTNLRWTDAGRSFERQQCSPHIMVGGE